MNAPILIVDDEPSNLATLREILSPEYALVFASSGSEALAAVAKHQPSLILLDVMMPQMDGYAVCRQLKANPQTENIPVIFVTSLAETVDEATGFLVGAVDYIVKPVSPPIVKARVRTHLSLVSTKQLKRSYYDVIMMLSKASRFKDADTGAHIWRIGAYSSALAAAIGWDAMTCGQLELAAPMHDIGKLGVPDAVLNKPDKLDPAEWSLVQTHTTVGHAILSQSAAPLLQMAATVALYHHERWDGSGYPHGLAGEAIPEMARIVAVVDVFDALTMDRPYKKPWPIERVMDTLKQGSGIHFEPRLIEAFTRILPDILAIQKEMQDSLRQRNANPGDDRLSTLDVPQR